MTSTPNRAAATAAPARRGWMAAFLSALAETSNVRRAARKAGISSATAYEARRKQRDFARKWQDALCEGFDNLEMELLGRLREGELKPPAGAARAARSFDNAAALRLLAAHREAREREHAQRSNVSAADIRASINRKIAAVKARVEAREAAHAAAANDA